MLICHVIGNCSCSDFINENGHGRCRKEDNDFNGALSCYVHQPSSCSDVITSSTNPDKQLSAEACLYKLRGEACMSIFS